MLDKLKDIVPEVNENKANLIYQKSIKPKPRFNFQLVLRFALIIIVLVPVFVIIGLGDNGGVNSDSAPNDSVLNGAPSDDSAPDSPEFDGSEDSADDGAASEPGIEETKYFTSEFTNGVLTLYFYDYYDVYYIKEVEGYDIISVTTAGEEIIPNESIYCVNSKTNIIIVFNTDNINDKVLFSVSNDNENFDVESILIE